MLVNPLRSAYGASDRIQIGCSHAATASALLGHCPAHRATPLVELPAIAAVSGVASVHIKGEWARMGLGSFKALGGGYAVALRVMARAEIALGRPMAPAELLTSAVRDIAKALTFACASAGNHGLAVAASARAFGAQATVFLSQTVPESFAERLRRKDATAIRAGATYEDSLAWARNEAARQGWTLISDTTGPGDVETPLDVMRGYTVLFAEAAEALDAAGGPATHIFAQAGVGGLAGAGAGYLRDRWGETFRFIVVEPDGAPCLLESIRQGRPATIAGGHTSLGRLDCKEPSLIAYGLLSRLADAFALISDAEAESAAARLRALGAPVSACGAAGAAGLLTLSAADRRRLGLTSQSRVLVIGTEASDPAL
jgi:diaminopropionate ammonia-lyase